MEPLNTEGNTANQLFTVSEIEFIYASPDEISAADYFQNCEMEKSQLNGVELLQCNVHTGVSK